MSLTDMIKHTLLHSTISTLSIIAGIVIAQDIVTRNEKAFMAQCMIDFNESVLAQECMVKVKMQRVELFNEVRDMKDSMRYNLVTNFKCVNCGNKLELSYEGNKNSDYKPETYDGITGAKKVEMSIYIHPCRKCYDEATAPIKALQSILNAKT